MTETHLGAMHTEIERLRAELQRERSARVAASAALAESEALLSALPLVVCVCGGPEHIVERVAGTAHPALDALGVGKTMRAAFGELEWRYWREAMDDALSRGKSSRIAAVPVSRGDSECFFDVDFFPRWDEHGRLCGVLWTAADVTPHVNTCVQYEAAWRAAQTARRAEGLKRARLSRVLEQAPFGVAILEGREHRVRFVNAVQQHRIGATSCLGLSARQAFPNPAMATLHDMLQDVFRSGRTRVLREQPLGWESATRAESQHPFLDTVYQPIRAESGEVEAVVVFTTDVTDSVRARQATAAACEEADAAREYLRNVLAAVPAAICLVTGPSFVFELANPAYVSLVQGRDLIGRTVAEVFAEVDPSAHLARMRRVFHSGEIEHAPEVRTLYDRDRTGRLSEAFFSTILGPLRKPDGSIIGVVAASLEVTQQVRQRERLSVLRQEAESARDALEREKALLATRISERTAQLAQTNSALAAEIAERRQAEAQLRELLKRMATTREDEQRRVARDLHDQVGQTLTALTLAVQAVRSDATLSPLMNERLTDLQQLADGLAREVHTLATRLRPTVLDDLGLQAAVAQLLSDFSTRCQVATDFQSVGLEPARLPSEIETVLYRIVQEAMTNVARHAHASHVTIIIEQRPGSVIVIVEDNGVGCDPEDAATAARLGWVGMRERALSVGGLLEIESQRGSGTTVIASVPIMEMRSIGSST